MYLKKTNDNAKTLFYLTIPAITSITLYFTCHYGCTVNINLAVYTNMIFVCNGALLFYRIAFKYNPLTDDRIY